MDLEHQPQTPQTGRGGTGQPATRAGNTPACPTDTQILAFYENRLQFWERRKIEHHLASCDRCRESLALLVRLREEAQFEAGTLLGEVKAPGTEEEVDRAQVARVLAYIERDEARQQTGRRSERRPWLPIPARAFAAIAALLVLAFGAVLVYRLYLSESPADAGLKALARAVKNERRTNVMPSGLPYSHYASSKRGGSGGDDLLFENAKIKLSFAESRSAPPADRLVLAKLYIARAEGPDTENALSILEELAAAGIQSPDVLNDTGAALCERGRYAEAIDYFNKALAANPRMNEALFNKAVAEEHIDKQAAREDYQKFMASASDPNWIDEARGRLKSIS